MVRREEPGGTKMTQQVYSTRLCCHKEKLWPSQCHVSFLPKMPVDKGCNNFLKNPISWLETFSTLGHLGCWPNLQSAVIVVSKAHYQDTPEGHLKMDNNKGKKTEKIKMTRVLISLEYL